MVLNRSSEFKGINFQIVCVEEIGFDSEWALTSIRNWR